MPLYLIEAGADPNAPAADGVTPLHRVVRNRCSAAVEALLRTGSNPRLRNDRGSTASDLAHWTTGRGGTGSAAAKAEQRIIIELLDISTARDTLSPPPPGLRSLVRPLPLSIPPPRHH